MREESIPVDLFNPGQVFGCVGFLEAAHLFLGDAEARFDWSDEADVRFRLRTGSDQNPFSVVLKSIAASKLCRYAPPGYTDPLPKKRKDEEAPAEDVPVSSETFPGPKADRMALPISLAAEIGEERHCIEVSHWADASDRKSFKLYAGNRSAAGIARAMLSGLERLWGKQRSELERHPFGVVTPVGGSFNFDPRGAWTGIDAGYSPNDQKHSLAASPVVEVLAAVGLQHARPQEYEVRQVRYGVWSSLLPPMLARPALSGISIAIPMRLFSFELTLSGKNKIVTFAKEETQP